MKKSPFFLLLLALFYAVTPLSAGDDSITLDDYQNGLAKEWKEKKFKGQTQYTVAHKDGRPCIAAVSKGAASGLFYEIKIDLAIMPILSWQWQIDDVLRAGDASKKSGDDYVARVYVVFPSPFFWRTKALNYIWDNKLPKETVLANAYTKNAMMVVVESGSEPWLPPVTWKLQVLFSVERMHEVLLSDATLGVELFSVTCRLSTFELPTSSSIIATLEPTLTCGLSSVNWS